jgi:uncharacterized protein (TIGR03067 family)
MKRLVALLLVLGLLAGSVAARDDEKDKKKTGTKKLADKDDKDKDKDKKDDKKDAKDKDAKDKDAKDKDKDKGKEKPPPLTEEEKKDLQALSGTFQVTEFTDQDGKKKDAAELKKMKVIQKAGEWWFHEGDDITMGLDRVFPKKTPKEIDSTYINGPAHKQTVKGIYEVSGDTIKYAYAEPNKDRPKDFKAGMGVTVMVFKRIKEKPKTDDKDKDKDKDKKDDKKKDDKKDDKKDEKKDKDKDKGR